MRRKSVWSSVIYIGIRSGDIHSMRAWVVWLWDSDAVQDEVLDWHGRSLLQSPTSEDLRISNLNYAVTGLLIICRAVIIQYSIQQKYSCSALHVCAGETLTSRRFRPAFDFPGDRHPLSPSSPWIHCMELCIYVRGYYSVHFGETYQSYRYKVRHKFGWG